MPENEEKFPAQRYFIQKVREVMPAHHSLADELAELLGISTDSSYRRIRGETAISIDECVKICNHYKITFDYFNDRHTGAVTFGYHHLQNSEESFLHYLQGIYNDLQRINSFKQKEIIFASDDIPIFHHFNFPLLTTFKLFYWQKAILNIPSFEGKKFGANLISEEMMQVAKNIYDLYCRVPSVEIWNDDTINSTLRQIEFYWDAGLFTNKADALLVCDETEQLLNTLQKQAETGSKVLSFNREPEFDNNFTLYNSEIMIGNNSILVNMEGSKVAYISHHTFNSMSTQNRVFCEETEQWIKNMIRKSIPISGVAEKQRYQFFKRSTDALNLVRKRIE